jgi:hypothetical protein
MGMVKRAASGVRQLMLYRSAIDQAAEAAEADEVDVIAVVEGYVADVRCSLCGDIRSWFPGHEAMQRIIERQRSEPAMANPNFRG